MSGKDFFTPLYEVAKLVNASLEPTEVLRRITEAVAKAMEVKACGLRVLDKSGKRLLMGANYGLSEGYIRKGPVLVEASGLDRKALSGTSVYVADAQTDPDFQYNERAKAEGIRSVLVVPLMVEGKPIGVLRVYTGEPREFSDEEVRFLEAVANLSAIALENARLHQALKQDYDLLLAHEYRLDDN